MRKFQLNISLHYLDEDNRPAIVNVYADSNNVWETICAGFSELINELQATAAMSLPSFGRKENWWRWPE